MSPSVQVGVPVLSLLGVVACAIHVGTTRRGLPSARAFLVVLALEAWWIVGFLVQLFVPDLEGKIFWDDVQLVPALALPFGYVAFAQDHSGRLPERGRDILTFLGIPPALACLWVFTDPLHGAARGAARLASEPPFGRLAYALTSVERFAAWEGVLLGVYALGLLVVHARTVEVAHRGRAWLISAGTAVGLCAHPFVLARRDAWPIAFALSSIVVTFGFARSRVVDLARMARDAVFEHGVDAIFVLDAKGRLVETNAAARLVLCSSPGLGAPASEALATWPALVDAIAQNRTRAVVTAPGDGGAYELVASELWAEGIVFGRALVLREVAEREHALERTTAARSSA